MKKDWNTIREILLEIEKIGPDTVSRQEYLLNGLDPRKVVQAFVLWEGGLIHGVNVISQAGESIVAYDLTSEGRELLGTMRNAMVWEQIKTLAQDIGIELTMTSIRRLSTLALVSLFDAPGRPMTYRATGTRGRNSMPVRSTSCS